MNSETSQHIKNIVIVGGGTAGWMAAAAFAKLLRGGFNITLVESDEISTVGVGEATIPPIQNYNKVLEIDEDEFVRETQGSFKLGIEFVNWGRIGERYTHGFGRFGQDLYTVPFEQYWHKLFAAGKAADIAEYSITRMAAAAGKFSRPQLELRNSPLSEIAYAFHFDAGLYARFLRRYAEARGVRRIEGKILEVQRSAATGHVSGVRLESGSVVAGEFFIDCSGFRGLLIEQTLQSGYEDWTHYLPCDRAIAVPTASVEPPIPYTRATAHAAGWQWRIPLQHRVGNGHVFCSQHMSEDEATAVLLANVQGEVLASPRTLKFVTGMRKTPWKHNVVAVGLSSGFMEPLESTSIHLIQTAIARIINFFPDREFSAADIDEYNRITRLEFESIRDFLILHYHANQRDDSAFWRACRAMDVPASLKMRMALYESRGRIFREGAELFSEVAWLQVMHGQGLRPASHHPLADLVPTEDAERYLASVRQVIANCVAGMPTHAQYIAAHCAARRAADPLHGMAQSAA
ncbi:tryptophan halogenase [beta proteobacterium AAP99]|nr:tryptophan halogenase [beta proteobacterium AAP99]